MLAGISNSTAGHLRVSPGQPLTTLPPPAIAVQVFHSGMPCFLLTAGTSAVALRGAAMQQLITGAVLHTRQRCAAALVAASLVFVGDGPDAGLAAPFLDVAACRALYSVWFFRMYSTPFLCRCSTCVLHIVHVSFWPESGCCLLGSCRRSSLLSHADTAHCSLDVLLGTCNVCCCVRALVCARTQREPGYADSKVCHTHTLTAPFSAHGLHLTQMRPQSRLQVPACECACKTKHCSTRAALA